MMILLAAGPAHHLLILIVIIGNCSGVDHDFRCCTAIGCSPHGPAAMATATGIGVETGKMASICLLYAEN